MQTISWLCIFSCTLYHCTSEHQSKRTEVGKTFFVKKYLITSLIFKLQKWFLHQNGVESNQKSKSDLTKLWPLVGR